MKKISIYVTNKKSKPANYYRIVQYAKQLPGAKVYNITPTFFFDLAVRFRENPKYKKKFRVLSHNVGISRMRKFLKKDMKRKPDYVIVQKSMTKGRVTPEIRDMQEKLVKNSKFIWDFDDNLIEAKQILSEEYDLYCKYSDKIVVTSEILKNTLPEECRDKVLLLPTTDMQMPIKEGELEEVNKKRRKIFEKEITLLWLATSANMEYLEPILDILDKTAKAIKERVNKDLVLKVVCDKRVKREFKYLKIKNIKWTRRRGVKEVRKCYIGIMPLTDNEYARGKGGFKIIQYISTGLPVIASNVGYNYTIFKDDIGYLLEDKKSKDCWKEAILNLVQSTEKWDDCSKKAYDVWKNNYNYEDNIKFWKNLVSE